MDHIWSIEARGKMDHDPFMAANDPQMKIRLPDYLKERLHEEARRLGVSMNQVIINALEDALIDSPLNETGSRIRLASSEVSRHDLLKEFLNISETIDARNEDLADSVERLASLPKYNSDLKSDSDIETKLYRSVLVKRISDLDEELTKLGRLYDDFSRRLKINNLKT